MLSKKIQSAFSLAVLLYSLPCGLTAHPGHDEPDVAVRGGGGGGYRGGYEGGRVQTPAARQDERQLRNDAYDYNNYPGGGVNVEYNPPYNPYGTDPNETGTEWDDSNYNQLQKEGP